MNRFFSLIVSVLCVATTNNVVAFPNIGVVGKGQNQCDYRIAKVYSKMSFSYMVTPTNFTVEMIYKGAGWMGFGFPVHRVHPEDEFKGFAKTNLMNQTLSVICEPETQTVSKFRLLNTTNDGAMFRGDSDTLMDSFCYQGTKDDGTVETVFRFTKALEQDGEPKITPDRVETFLWAFGYSNSFPGIHARRSVVQLDTTACSKGTVNSQQVQNSVPKVPAQNVCTEMGGKKFLANNGKMKTCRFLKRMAERKKKAARSNCLSDKSTAAEVCCKTCKPYLATSNN